MVFEIILVNILTGEKLYTSQEADSPETAINDAILNQVNPSDFTWFSIIGE